MRNGSLVYLLFPVKRKSLASRKGSSTFNVRLCLAIQTYVSHELCLPIHPPVYPSIHPGLVRCFQPSNDCSRVMVVLQQLNKRCYTPAHSGARIENISQSPDVLWHIQILRVISLDCRIHHTCFLCLSSALLTRSTGHQRTEG